MEDIKFKSLNDLYKRLLPALEAKTKEFKRCNYSYVHEEDIWNCCKENFWNNSESLGLYKMVDDILNTDNLVFSEFLKKQLDNSRREIRDDDEIR